MIYGIGTDICDIRRIRDSLECHGDRFAEKVLTAQELQVWRAAAHAGLNAACAIWPRAFRPRKPSARL